MVTSMLSELERAGSNDRPGMVLADAGYWNEEHINRSSPTTTSKC
jgi:hypothetical protein